MVFGLFKKFLGIKTDKQEKKTEGNYQYLKVLPSEQNPLGNIKYIRTSHKIEPEKSYKAVLTNPINNRTINCKISPKEYSGGYVFDFHIGNKPLYLTSELSQEQYAKELSGVIERYSARLYTGKLDATTLNQYKRFEDLLEGLKPEVSEETRNNLETKLNEAKQIISEKRKHEVFRRLANLAYSSEDIETFTHKIKADKPLYQSICRRAENGDDLEASEIIDKLYNTVRKRRDLRDFSSFQRWHDEYKARKESKEKGERTSYLKGLSFALQRVAV